MMSVSFAAPPISLPQFIISVILFFVLFFGIGFIFNMILKTTWLPLIIYAAISVYLLIRIQSPLLVDISILCAGLIGAGGSGWTIQYLRKKGYRMF